MRFPRTLYLLPLTVFAILLTTQAYADSLNNKGANIGKDNGTALNALLPLAEEGHAAAQYFLGSSYAKGLGGPQDYAQAGYWWLKAAGQGHAVAQSNLGQSAVSLFYVQHRWVRSFSSKTF